MSAINHVLHRLSSLFSDHTPNITRAVPSREKGARTVAAIGALLLSCTAPVPALSQVSEPINDCAGELVVKCSLQAPGKGKSTPRPVDFGGVIQPQRSSNGECIGSVQHNYVGTRIKVLFRGDIDANEGIANGALELSFLKGSAQTGFVSTTFNDILLDRATIPGDYNTLTSAQSTIVTDAAAAVLKNPGQAPRRKAYPVVCNVSAYEGVNALLE